MAHRFRRSIASLNAEANAVCEQVDGGWLRIYNGTQPDAPDDPVTTQDLLAELAYGSPAFAAAVNGVASAHTIDPEASALTTGTANWFRTVSMGGAPVFDGSVGTTANFDIRLASVDIEAGARVVVESQTYTAKAGTS